MAVSMSRTGSIVTVTVTVDVSGMGLPGYTPAQRRQLVARAAAKQLHEADRAEERSDAEIDADYAARVAATNAERDAVKAARPSGST